MLDDSLSAYIPDPGLMAASWFGEGGYRDELEGKPSLSISIKSSGLDGLLSLSNSTAGTGGIRSCRGTSKSIRLSTGG